MDKRCVTISIDDAENVSSNLADLLCWWQGFKTGLKIDKDEFSKVDYSVAENGIKELQELNIKIKKQLGLK